MILNKKPFYSDLYLLLFDILSFAQRG